MIAPAATLTLAGVVAFALLLDNVTVRPPVGAGPLTVTVQAAVPGEVTFEGVQVMPLGVTAGTIVSTVLVDVDAVPPATVAARMTRVPVRVFGMLKDAERTAVWLFVTVPAVAANNPLLAPAGIVNVAGTLNALELLDNATNVDEPPEG